MSQLPRHPSGPPALAFAESLRRQRFPNVNQRPGQSANIQVNSNRNPANTHHAPTLEQIGLWNDPAELARRINRLTNTPVDRNRPSVDSVATTLQSETQNGRDYEQVVVAPGQIGQAAKVSGSDSPRLPGTIAGGSMPGAWPIHDAGPSSDPDRGLAQNDNSSEQTEETKEPAKTKKQKENERKNKQKKERQARQRTQESNSVDENVPMTVAEWTERFESRYAQMIESMEDPALSMGRKDELLEKGLARMLQNSSGDANAASALELFKHNNMPHWKAMLARLEANVVQEPSITERQARRQAHESGSVDENVAPPGPSRFVTKWFELFQHNAEFTVTEWIEYFQHSGEFTMDPELSMEQKRKWLAERKTWQDQLSAVLPNAASAVLTFRDNRREVAYLKAKQARFETNYALQRLSTGQKIDMIPEPTPDVYDVAREMAENARLKAELARSQAGGALVGGPSVGLAGWKFNMIHNPNSDDILKATLKAQPMMNAIHSKADEAEDSKLPAPGGVQRLNPHADARKPKGKGKAMDDYLPKRHPSELTQAEEPKKPKDKGKGKAVDNPQPTRQRGEPTLAVEPQQSTSHGHSRDSTSGEWQDTVLPSGRTVKVQHQRLKVPVNKAGFKMLRTELVSEASSGRHQSPSDSPDTSEAPELSMKPSDSSSSTNAQPVPPEDAAPLINGPDGSTSEEWQDMTVRSGRVVQVSHQRMKVPAVLPVLRVCTDLTEPSGRVVQVSHQRMKGPAVLPVLRVCTGRTEPTRSHSTSATSPLEHEVMPAWHFPYPRQYPPKTPELITGSSDPNSGKEAEPVTPDNAAPLPQRRANDDDRHVPGNLPTTFEFKAGNTPASDTSEPVTVLNRSHNASTATLDRSQRMLRSSVDEARAEARALRSLKGERSMLKAKLRADMERLQALDDTIQDLERSKGRRPISDEPDPADDRDDPDSARKNSE